jgi:tRNA synthetases class I (E and Q), anti-codon binding domain
MAVKCKGCVRMSVQRVPVGLTSISVPVHPRNAKLGDRVLHICNSIIIEAEDAASIDEGEEVTLLRWTSANHICHTICSRWLCAGPRQ